MKNAITRILILLFAVCTYAQQGINYKAIIKDDSGNIFSSSPVTIQFIIYEGAALTSNVYQETHTTTTDANGIVIINIGEGTIGVSGIFDAIDWGIDAHFLNTQIDNGAGLVDMGTIGFKTVPYALHAENGIPSGGTEGQVLTIVDGNIVWTSSTGCLDNFYADTDGDGYGDPNGLVMACFAPTGYVLDNTDCDDTKAITYPGAPEILDGEDNDCNGLIDDGLPATVGDYRDGGIVFWVDPADPTHGLIVALHDYELEQEWGCYEDLLSVPNVPFIPPDINSDYPNGPGADIGDGLSNTNAILNDCPTAPAALAARSLGPEWFLPSIRELYQAQSANIALVAHGGEIVHDFTWSSTEIGVGDSWELGFNAIENVSDKFDFNFVRAIRAF